MHTHSFSLIKRERKRGSEGERKRDEERARGERKE